MTIICLPSENLEKALKKELNIQNGYSEFSNIEKGIKTL